ncbi:flagellar assembly protein FliW, partial [mine drainage metagenome]
MEPQQFDFSSGLPGFPGRRLFQLSMVDNGPLHYLTAIDPPGPRFAVVDPEVITAVIGDYEVRLDDEVVSSLGIEDRSDV